MSADNQIQSSPCRNVGPSWGTMRMDALSLLWLRFGGHRTPVWLLKLVGVTPRPSASASLRRGPEKRIFNVYWLPAFLIAVSYSYLFCVIAAASWPGGMSSTCWWRRPGRPTSKQTTGRWMVLVIKVRPRLWGWAGPRPHPGRPSDWPLGTGISQKESPNNINCMAQEWKVYIQQFKISILRSLQFWVP